jgi:DNA polymerase-1
MPPMPGPLLAVDAPSLMYRAFFALPSSITGAEGRPVNALLGTANLVLREHERFAPRAVVLCWGAEAAAYRAAALPAYHADRPEMPDDLSWQWERAPAFFEAFGWTSLHAGDLEADDLLGALAAAEAPGQALLFTGDRDMFQCVNDRVHVLFPGGRGKDGAVVVDADGVRERYGIEPEQVPDFIALRGDPSDGIPGAKGIGEKGAGELLRAHGDLETLIERAARDDAGGIGPARAVRALRDQADELRSFKDIATLRPIAIDRPADGPLDHARAAEAARALGMARLAERLAAD